MCEERASVLCKLGVVANDRRHLSREEQEFKIQLLLPSAAKSVFLVELLWPQGHFQLLILLHFSINEQRCCLRKMGKDKQY